MKQFFLRTCLAVLSLLTAATSFAQWFEADGIYYEINDDKKSVSVTRSDDSYSGPVTIPSSVSRKDEESDEDEEGTYVVTSIENYAFNFSGEFDPFFHEIDERPRLTSIYIPESVTSIGKEAFWGCSMTSINIPLSITSIGPSTFWNCNRLNSITISSSVTTIEESAFGSCI